MGIAEKAGLMALQGSSASSDKLYSLFYSKLADKYSGLDSPDRQYQFPGDVTNAEWYSGTNTDFLEFAAGNRMPISHGSIYLPNTGLTGSSFQSYRNWINAIITPLTSDDPTVLGYQNNLQTSITQRSNLDNQSYNAYDAWKSNNPGPATQINTYELWFNSDYGASYKTQISALNEKIDEYNSKLKQYQEQANKSLTDAIAANNPSDGSNPNYKTYTDSNTGINIVAGITSVTNQNGNSLSQDVTNWRNGQNLQNWSALLDTITVPVHEYKTITVEQYHHHSYFFGLFSSTSISRETITQEITTYEHFSIEVNVSGLGYYPVSRSAWFDANLLQTYKDYKLVTPNTPQSVFNPETGTMALVPAGMIIGWNPTFRITVADAFYQKYQSVIQSGLGIQVGSMMVAGVPQVEDGPQSGSKILTYKTPEEQLQSLSPQVLGYSNYITTVS